MKKLIFIISLIIISCNNNSEITQVVDASCGQCQFGLTSQKGCDLAVKIDNKVYFVDGTSIDDHGDAHNKQDGFCEVVRRAKVTGKFVENRFVATKFEMIDKK